MNFRVNGYNSGIFGSNEDDILQLKEVFIVSNEETTLQRSMYKKKIFLNFGIFPVVEIEGKFSASQHARERERAR